VNYLLDKFSERPVRIDWVTSETSFRALDTSSFSRETFSAAYAQVFSGLNSELRKKINEDDKSVANGMPPLFAQMLYQRLYRLRHLSASEGLFSEKRSLGSSAVEDGTHQSFSATVSASDMAVGRSIRARSTGTGLTCAVLRSSNLRAQTTCWARSNSFSPISMMFISTYAERVIC
jgi:lysine/ornithine N-monooxygenase